MINFHSKIKVVKEVAIMEKLKEKKGIKGIVLMITVLLLMVGSFALSGVMVLGGKNQEPTKQDTALADNVSDATAVVNAYNSSTYDDKKTYPLFLGQWAEILR